MWQLSNLQIDSSVIQIVQSYVLRNSVDTTAAITNMVDVYIFPTLFRKVLFVAVLVKLVHVDLAMHATLVALGTLPRSVSL